MKVIGPVTIGRSRWGAKKECPWVSVTDRAGIQTYDSEDNLVNGKNLRIKLPEFCTPKEARQYGLRSCMYFHWNR